LILITPNVGANLVKGMVQRHQEKLCDFSSWMGIVGKVRSIWLKLARRVELRGETSTAYKIYVWFYRNSSCIEKTVGRITEW
jgi:hypothetical protein